MHSNANALTQSASLPADVARLEKRARRFWVSLIVGLLGLQVIIGFVSIWLSVGDPSVAIVPNYHQKALDWDATHRAREMTRKLGWHIAPIVGEFISEKGQRLVRVAVRDRNGQPVTGLHLSGKAYHHARGATIYELRFAETDPGYYEATTSLAESGLWELQLQLEGDHGVASDVRDLVVD